MIVITIWIISSLLALAVFIYINYSSGQDLTPYTLIIMILASVIPFLAFVVFLVLLPTVDIIILKGKRK